MITDIVFTALFLSVNIFFWFIEIGGWFKLIMEIKNEDDRKRIITLGAIGNLFILYIFIYIININF